MSSTKAGFVTILTIAILLGGNSANADFNRTSNVEGYFCKGFIIKSCDFRDVDALSENEGSQRFSVIETFKDVDEFAQPQNRCHLHNDVRWTDPKYHAHRRNDEGGWEHLGIPESLTFKCVRD